MCIRTNCLPDIEGTHLLNRLTLILDQVVNYSAMGLDLSTFHKRTISAYLQHLGIFRLTDKWLKLVLKLLDIAIT